MTSNDLLGSSCAIWIVASDIPYVVLLLVVGLLRPGHYLTNEAI